MKSSQTESKKEMSEFLVAMRNGILLGAAILLVTIPALRMAEAPDEPDATKITPAPRLASFGTENPSPDVRHVANWAVFTGNHQGKSIILVDKKNAKVYAFDPQGKLKSSAPVLLGSAIGDDAVPGVGDKPLSAVLPGEKTTHAGRFIAEPGVNTKGEDIVWVDYNAAMSMHRVRPLIAAERRLERLASPTPGDNRISFGCINLPVAFYDNVLSPTVRTTGAVIYVLPETRTPQEVFGSFDVAGGSPAAPPATRQNPPLPGDSQARTARRNRDSAQ